MTDDELRWEIKLGMRQVIQDHLLAGAISTMVEDALLEYLHSKNVVIKKEVKSSDSKILEYILSDSQYFYPVIPLVKEKE
jgi:hypothetical protein